MIPIVQDKRAPGSHNNKEKSSTNDILPQADLPELFDEPGHLLDRGVYVGEGLPPISQKLAKKITKGDLPELWPAAHQEGEGKIRRNWKITNIFTLIQCFSLYISVRGRQKPKLIAELMAYHGLDCPG